MGKPKGVWAAVIMAFAAAAECTLSAAADAAEKKPNFILFLVDDLGFSSLGITGNSFHETPRIDELFQRGMRFTDAYAACTVCSPSRAAILTGKYPARLHLTDWIAGHDHPRAKLRVPAWSQEIAAAETTLPEALKQHGYRTIFVGKWHLMPLYKTWSSSQLAAGREANTPQSHGFDVNVGGREWGQPNGPGRYFTPFDLPGLDDAQPGEYLTDRLTDEALKQIEAAGDQPFFLEMAHYAVHTPIMGRADQVEHFRNRVDHTTAASRSIPTADHAAEYAAMHASVDQSVGRIMDRIEALGKRDETIVIFTGDNGGDRHWACRPLRGLKGTAYEGGVREPTCIVWPKTTKTGSVCKTPIIGTDFYPTILAMADLPLLPRQHVDGMNLAPLLRGTAGLDRAALYWHYPHYHRSSPFGAIRKGEWKLIEWFEDNRLELYDLSSDPAEVQNLATVEKELAAQLHRQLADWRMAIGAQMPTPNPRWNAQAATPNY